MTMWGSWLLWCILPPLPPKSCRLLPPPLLLSSLHHINLYLLALHQFASNFSLSPCSLSTFPPSHSSLSTSLYHPTLYQHVPYRLAHSSLSSCLPPCSYHVPYHIHPYQLLYHLVLYQLVPCHIHVYQMLSMPSSNSSISVNFSLSTCLYHIYLYLLRSLTGMSDLAACLPSFWAIAKHRRGQRELCVEF